VLLSTKATFRMGDGENNLGSSRLHLMQAVEDSLRRLKTDHIDLYHLHGFDSYTPVEETLLAFGRHRSTGQSALHRVFKLLGLAPHEVAGGVGPRRAFALCWALGVLPSRGSRVRVGADATRHRPGCRRNDLEPAYMRRNHRQHSSR
jgi:hypothetical protein